MRQCGAVWRRVWPIAFGLLCVYIGFDVLDLDGSQLQLPSRGALTIESSAVEADRALRARPTPLPVRLSPSTLAPSILRPVRPATVPFRSLRCERRLPRRHLSRSARLAPSADPV